MNWFRRWHPEHDHTVFTTTWHRGLYGRIALGFIALIAIILAVQTVGLVWLVQEWNASQTPAQQRGRSGWLQGLSRRLSAELEAAPDLNVGGRLLEMANGDRLFVIMKDGEVIGAAPPPDIVKRTVVGMSRLSDDAETPRVWAYSPYGAALVKVHGKVVGCLGLVPRSTLERFAPQIGAIGIGLLSIGILVSSLLIVRPVRRRVRDLQRAAGALGNGDATARARTDGNDEVAELARSFNAMADELGRRTAALETSDRLRRQLIADVSHELMTPLTAVLGHLETLTMDEVRLDDAQRLKQVNVATREAWRLKRLIGDLLHAARLEAGAVALDIEPIGTREMLLDVAARHEDECAARRIQLIVHVDRKAERFEADPFRIEQALENLTANALRHTPDGGRVELRAHVSGETFVLEVSDSGEGIAEEHQPFIFDRFYKASSTRALASSGSGLGLSIVKAIAVRHEGRVSVSSVLSQGTTIRIELPWHGPVPAPSKNTLDRVAS